MRPIQATIHLNALRHNLAKVKATAPHSKVMAVVKANAYGHGLLNAAQGLAAADGLAVLRVEEGLSLRKSGYRQVILLLEGVFEADELPIAADADLTLAVHCNEQIDMLEKVGLSRPVGVFVKMNTGMNRLGFIPDAYATAVERLVECANVSSITLMTHFATADEDVGIAEPVARFTAATQGLAYPVSLANSAAILRYPGSHHDWVRPGIMLYGATPVQGTPAHAFGLKPAMSLKSRLIAIQELRPGEGVGYGQKFIAHERTRVGVVACGYADGYPRHAPSGTSIAVAGQVTQTVGRVSMDMLFADITHIPEAAIGSEVELWGTQIPVDAVAEAAGTVGYELLCAVAPRVPMAVAD